MNVEFEDIALEDLFLTGTTSDKRYKRLPQDIVKRYVIVNALLTEISKHYE